MERRNGIIVVGGGAAGLSAAAEAAERGSEVTVLEANPKAGGNGIFAEGMFALNSREQAARGITCDVDHYFTLAMEFSHWKSNARLVRRLLEHTGANLDWLCGHGLQIATVENHGDPDRGGVTHFVADKHTGRDVMNVLRRFCEAHEAITIHTGTRVKKLLADETGRVTGVLAEQAGEERVFYARGVILACGGFSGNRELAARVAPTVDPEAFAHLRGMRMNGDGLLLAEAVGGELLRDGCFENAGPTYAGAQEVMGLVTKRYAIWLNAQGRRFADESVGDNFVFGCNAVYSQPGHLCYVLLDGAMVEKAMEGPVDFLAGPEAVKKGMAGLGAVLKQEMDRGRLVVAPDLAGVANFMGVPVETLEAEIAEYNAACRQGWDSVFLKDPAKLVPLERGNYVAIRCGVDYILSHGGIRVDERMRVQCSDGKPVPGLFAAGADISGVDSNGYQVALGGHSFGFALTGGRLAAESLLEDCVG